MVKQKKHPDFQTSVATFTQSKDPAWGDGSEKRYTHLPPPTPADDPIYELKEAASKKAASSESHNPIFVMDAFFRRYADMTNGRETTPNSIVSFPDWMVKPIAEWFEVYCSNLVLQDDSRTTLDDCAKIKKSHKKEFNPFVITKERIIEEAYYWIWLFGISRTSAIKLAYEFLKAKAGQEAGAGQDELFKFPAEEETVVQYADREEKDGYCLWLEANGHLKKWIDEYGRPILDPEGKPFEDTICSAPASTIQLYLDVIKAISLVTLNRLPESITAPYLKFDKERAARKQREKEWTMK